MENTNKDHLFAKQLDWVENFKFDESVANVFQDMITRSVPGYRTTLAMIGVISSRFVTAGSRVYDLGCSLGAGTAIAANAAKVNDYEVVAVDTSESMITKCRATLKKQKLKAMISYRQEDIRTTELSNASVVILNFTLQFLPREDRAKLIKRIHAALNSGGVLVLSEKIHFEDSAREDLLYKLHHEFKRANGYSDLEISQKRTALEDTLITETLSNHQSRIKAAGFSSSHLWFQCFNFCSLIAAK
ncbi:MAG: carboxy-S-adenosyl-L-methionine synthase CmoA [Opitutales bacterium]|nr:carboxy-S-adenosyl-L-methionine synthase CmoA [Opitutales bacterium]